MKATDLVEAVSKQQDAQDVTLQMVREIKWLRSVVKDLQELVDRTLEKLLKAEESNHEE